MRITGITFVIIGVLILLFDIVIVIKSGIDFDRFEKWED